MKNMTERALGRVQVRASTGRERERERERERVSERERENPGHPAAPPPSPLSHTAPIILNLSLFSLPPSLSSSSRSSLGHPVASRPVFFPPFLSLSLVPLSLNPFPPPSLAPSLPHSLAPSLPRSLPVISLSSRCPTPALFPPTPFQVCS
jgi:hypothetical protein